MSWNDPIPLTDHVARKFTKKQYHDELKIVDHTAFRLRHDRDETELSVSWLEFYEGGQLDQLTRIYRDLTIVYPSIRNINNRLGILNAGETIEHVYTKSKIKKKIRILSKPNDKNPSHHGMYDILPEEDLVATLLGECVKDIVTVSKLNENMQNIDL